MFGSLHTPLGRVRLGLAVLGGVVVLATLGYRLCGYGWLDAVWMVVITISTVGYGESSTTTPAVQALSVVVILVGISAASVTFSGVLQVMVEGEIQKVLGRRRMTREIEQLRNHVIICGYGRTGHHLSEGLSHSRVPFVVIDSVPENVAEAREDGCLCILGNATEEQVLRDAGVDRASFLMSTLPSDAENVFITLTARNMNLDLEIICRAEQASTESKLRQAGANRVLMPTIVAARQMVTMITRPSTYDLMELVAESKFLDVQLDEFLVTDNTRLVGVTVAASEAHRRHRLLVVAIKKANHEMVFNPDADYCFATGDTLIMMGREQDIAKFRDFFGA
ncbi:MAG: potassium channel protein [Planctomycetales bacterium]|nr:potassium channel protein [Planctomycetales bacterium]